MPDYQIDSPLSITASIAGILTFLAAIAAALYVRFTYLRNADTEYFQVKASLSWFKTESVFMHELLTATHMDTTQALGPGAAYWNEREREMYSFVVEDLARLEARLLEIVEEAETKANAGEKGGGEAFQSKSQKQKGWTIVPKGVKGKTDIAMSWLPVRMKALELVRQRDALGSRVLFAQMSMINTRVRAQEARLRKREEDQKDRLNQLENLVHSQHEKLDRLESLVYRMMHRDRAFQGKVQEL